MTTALLRSHRGSTPRPWGYCDNPDHLYGRRFVDGHLESTRLIEETPTDQESTP